MGSVVTSRSISGEMVITLAQNARDVGSIPTLGATFPTLITPTTLICMTRILYELYGRMVVEPTLYMYVYAQSLPVCNCKH